MQIENHHICSIAPGVRLQFEKAQDAWVLLYPEGMVTLGETAGDILREVDGNKSVDAIVQSLQQQYSDADGIEADVVEFLGGMVAQGWVKAHE